MGTAMREIKVPAKCAARLGQCFSSTVDAARVEQHQKVCAVHVTSPCLSHCNACRAAFHRLGHPSDSPIAPCFSNTVNAFK
jgi:hypothetical protein